ncbi:Mitochondrial outer membrane translocase complex, subunit Tom5 [Ceraceosorus bombacis]|uniref:Mitochondrial outer membrane translocase complex, subunit Tom5 n=1 Tax=Ceraceosorus bombacis TaxID=401625 RepID=A0A0P1BJB5_9BASI|nr:Mitochondrial outer membrane translocase complex, subunit Tom5 [Ceraceosorus bombacis]
MFGGPPPPPSALEVAAMRARAHATLKSFVTYAAGLYATPYIFHYIGKLLR